MQSARLLVRIITPHFVAGIEVEPDKGRVVRCAPIVHYMQDWTLASVGAYVRSKRWSYEVSVVSPSTRENPSA